jgi:hypothetical protein
VPQFYGSVSAVFVERSSNIECSYQPPSPPNM